MNLSKQLRLTALGVSFFVTSIAGTAAMALEIPSATELKAKAEKALSDLEVFKSPENGFSLKYPRNWEKATGQNPLVCRFLTDNGLVSYRVSVEKLAVDMTVAEYAKNVDDELEKQYPKSNSQLTRVEEVSSKLGALDAHKSIYVLKLDTTPNPPSAKMLQYLVITNHRAYAFNYTAIESAYDAFLPVITEVLNSLEFQPVTTDGATEKKVETH